MKPFLTALAILTTSCCFSQVYKYKAFASCFKDDLVQEWKDVKWHESNILVVINLDKERISTYGKKEANYDIIEQSEIKILSNGVKRIDYVAIDEKGEKCSIEFLKYEDKKEEVADLLILYSSFEMAFRLKDNN